MKIKKYLATVLVLAVGLSVFGTACSNDKEDPEATNSPQEALEADRLIEASEMPEELPEGVEWFDYTERPAAFEYIEQDPDTHISSLAASSDSIYVIAEKMQWEPFKLFDRVVKFDKDWNVVKETELTLPEGYNLLSINDNGGELYFYGFMDSGEYFFCPFNEDSGELKTSDMTMFTDDYMDAMKVGDKVVLLTKDDKLQIRDSQGKEEIGTVDLSQVINDDGLVVFYNIGRAGEKTVILEGCTNCNNEVSVDLFYCVDIETGEITKLKDAEFMPAGTRQVYYIKDSTLAINDNGIYKIDIENKTNELILSFNCTNCNRYILKNSKPIAMDDDNMTFVYVNKAMDVPYGQPGSLIYSLDRAEKYEQSGKKVISVASTEPLSFETAEAIYRYNLASDDTYAVFDDRYTVELELWEGDGYTPDEKAFMTAEAYGRSYDQLKVDLVAGDGPDLFIGKDLNLSLSDSQYLVDMKDLITADTDPEFFSNVFDASVVNGGLYQVPLDFYVEGLTASADKFGGKSGMTFEEYDTFVKTVCNGMDPCYDHVPGFSRAKIATDLFAGMHDEFIKDGKIDVNNDAFKAILDYCANLPKQSYTLDYNDPGEYENFIDEVSALPVSWGKVDDYDEFANQCLKGDIALCGTPSYDGRSAVAQAILTCSVTSNAEDVDKCAEFVDILLSDEVQMLTDLDAIPVNKNALSMLAGIENKYNNETEEQYGDYSYVDYDNELIDSFITYLESATTGAVSDRTIDIIIYEEIPAYLEGQKTFEEVAELINNRATTVFEERK